MVRRCLALSFCDFGALLQVSNSVSEDLILAEVVESDDVARSMRPCLVFSALLFACTTSQPQPVAILGRYTSHLSDRDTQEIRHVVLAYQKRPLRKIDAIGRNKVRVKTGSEKDLSRFPLIKRGGKVAGRRNR